MARENKIVLVEAEDATITTATITIKTLQVSRRQMTQAVFRQLPGGVLVDEEKVGLLGIPWGWVNYHWGNMDTDGKHFLFQSGTRLYRQNFVVRPSDDFRSLPTGAYRDFCARFKHLARLHHMACILDGWRPQAEPFHNGYTWVVRYSSEILGYYPSVDFQCDTIIIKDKYTHKDNVSDALSFLDDRNKLNIKVQSEENRIKKEAVISWLDRQIVQALGQREDPSQIMERIRSLEGKAVDYFRRWDELMERLHTVEQLFIAC